MNVAVRMSERQASVGGILTFGFGAAVAMWAVGYVCRLPQVSAPPPVLLTALVLVLLGAGLLAGRWLPRNIHATWAGAVTGLLNLLVLGSLLSDAREAGLTHWAPLWIAGFVCLCAVLMTLGALAAPRSNASTHDTAWPASFAAVAVGATLLLIAIGGVVTAAQAGLAVPDWPKSFGYNMFLYPMSKMTGGVYLEHAHRLMGSLIGFTTLALCAYVLWVDRRGPVRALAVAALALVIAQGVMGGYRVTNQSTTLAIVHGVTAHLFLSLLVILTCLLSRFWQRTRSWSPAGVDRWLGPVLVAALVIQLCVGAVLRHTGAALHTHIAIGILAALISVACGLRSQAIQYAERPASVLGSTLLILPLIQIFLGVIALIAVNSVAEAGAPHDADLIFTTLHQTGGACLLACSVGYVMVSRRVRPGALPANEPDAVASGIPATGPAAAR